MGGLFKKKRSVRTVFFDIGGVVVDAPMANYLKLGCQFFECDEVTLQVATAKHLAALETNRIKSEEFWELVSASVAETGGNAIPAWKFKGFWEGLLTDNLHVNQELLDLVRRLRAHCRVAVLSNVIKEHAVILQKEKVYEHFNPVVLSCEVGYRKPDPKIFAKAAELSKTAPGRCLLVDDVAENLEAAEKSGWRIFHYTNLDDFKMSMCKMGLIDHV